MSTPLSHRPFEEPFAPRLMALKADKQTRRTVVTRIHPGVIVHRSLGPVSEPPSALTQMLTEHRAESEPEPVAAKKKRSPEAIAKQKATLASKKRKVAKANGGQGAKAAFIRENPGIPVPELVELARKQGLGITQAHAYQVRRSDKGRAPKKSPKTQQLSDGPSSNEASLTDLLQAIIEATSEIARRLSQLTL